LNYYFFEEKEDIERTLLFLEKKSPSGKIWPQQKKKKRETFGLLFLAIKFATYFITSSLYRDISQKTCAQLAPIKRSLHTEAETTPKCHPRVHQVSYAWHSCPTTTHPSKTLLNTKPNSLT
jgi:hypothetical protein